GGRTRCAAARTRCPSRGPARRRRPSSRRRRWTAPRSEYGAREGDAMSVITAYAPVVLEPAAQGFVAATGKPPFLYELTPHEARAVLDDVQAQPVAKPVVDDNWVRVPTGFGDVGVRIVRPPGAV